MKIFGTEIKRSTRLNDDVNITLKIEEIKRAHSNNLNYFWMETGPLLQAMRGIIGLTQKKIANKISIARSTLSRFENGHHVHRPGLIENAYAMFLELYLRDHTGFSGQDMVRLTDFEEMLIEKKAGLFQKYEALQLEIHELDEIADKLEYYSPEYRIIERESYDLDFNKKDIEELIQTIDNLIRIIRIGLIRANIERYKIVDKDRDSVLAAHNL